MSYRFIQQRGRGLGEWPWVTLSQAQTWANAPNPNFVNQGDTINFELELNWASSWYSDSMTSDLRDRLARDGLRPIIIDDTQVRVLTGGTLKGQVYAEHGYGSLSDVADRIFGMAVGAGMRVNRSATSPRVEIYQRGQAPPNTINVTRPKDDPSNNGGSLDKIIEDLKKTFGMDGTTLALIALLAFFAFKNK